MFNTNVSINEQKIVALWSAPRCVSTAFEKTFFQRPDTAIVHEPFTDCYYFSKLRKSKRYGDWENLSEYDGVKAIHNIQSNVAPIVFFKELAFQSFYYINNEFLNSIINTFIIRHPEEVLASLYPLKPDFTEEEFGFTALENIWTIVTEKLRQEPILVDANDFCRHPDIILDRYCCRIGVKFLPQMLNWNKGKLKEWHSYEAESQAKWHKTLENSTGILPPTQKVKVNILCEHKIIFERALKIYEKLILFKL